MARIHYSCCSLQSQSRDVRGFHFRDHIALAPGADSRPEPPEERATLCSAVEAPAQIQSSRLPERLACSGRAQRCPDLTGGGPIRRPRSFRLLSISCCCWTPASASIRHSALVGRATSNVKHDGPWAGSAPLDPGNSLLGRIMRSGLP